MKLTLTETWAERAACVGKWDVFDYDEDAARALCRTCPVRATCLEYAVVNVEDGIWGQTNNDERGRIRAAGRTGLNTCDCGEGFRTKKALAAHASHQHGKRKPRRDAVA
jgi:WhiB family redox-sensing transcriptional regulator